MSTLRTWLGEVTTGHGVMIIAGTLLSVLTGSASWATAAPLLAAGAIGLIWPENATLQSAGQAIATDVIGAINAYNNKSATPPRA